jgi:hypothetical protein
MKKFSTTRSGRGRAVGAGRLRRPRRRRRDPIRTGGGRHQPRPDLSARTHLANPFDHDAIACRQTAVDHPVVADPMVGHDRALLGLVLGRNHVHGLQPLQLLHGFLRNSNRIGALERCNDHANEQARTQKALGIGHRNAYLQRAAFLIDRRIDKIQLARERVVGAVRQPNAKRRCLIGPLTRRVLQALLQLEQPVLADTENHPHRVVRVQGGQQRLLRGDQGARLDQRTAHHAVPARMNRGVFQIDLGVPQQCLLSVHQRSAGLFLSHRSVVVRLADGLLLDQPAVTRQILPGVDQIGLGLRHGGPRLSQLRLERSLIDHIEQSAFADPRAVLKRLPLKQAGDLRADFNRVRRLRLRDIFVIDGDRRELHLHHGDFRRWRRRYLRFAAATTQRQAIQAECQQPQCSARFEPGKDSHRGLACLPDRKIFPTGFLGAWAVYAHDRIHLKPNSGGCPRIGFF